MPPKRSEDEIPQAADLDTVLAEELGGLSGYQARVVLLCGLAIAISGLSTSEYVFTTRRIPTRCAIPECENTTGTSEFRPPWLADAVPSKDGVVDSCHRYANVSAGVDADGSCPATVFDQTTIVDCDEYVYENINTIVYTLGLACDEWRRSLVGSARTVGALVSLSFAGVLSDRCGRRTALTVVSFNTACLGLVRYFAPSYVSYVIAIFAEAALGAGAILTCAFILAIETVPAKYRSIVAPCLNSCFAIGQMVLALAAWAFPNWKHLTLVIYTPQLLTIAFVWTHPESVRWSLNGGRYQEAEKVLKNIAKSNGKELSEKTMIALKAASEKTKKEAEEKDVKSGGWLVMEIFRHKPVLQRCIVVPFWWVTLTLIYYGLGINAVNISGNPYVNFSVICSVDIPGFCCAMLLLHFMGRRTLLILFLWICAACQVAFIFIPHETSWASLLVYLVGKLCIAGVGSVTYVYTSELFPTRCRQTLFGYASMVGRLGSIVAPLTPALGETVWAPLPYVIFAAMALASGLLALLVPETRGCPLPDTMQDAACIGVKVAKDPPPPRLYFQSEL